MTLVRRRERERRFVVRPGRRRFAGLLLLSLLFMILGVWMGWTADDLLHRAVGWLNVAFFGLGTLIFAAQFVPGASGPTLDPQGFTVVSLWRKRRHRWQEVEFFQAQPVGRQVMILFDVPGADGWTIRLSRSMYGVSHGLPDSHGLRPEELAAFMAVVREWAAASGTP